MVFFKGHTGDKQDRSVSKLVLGFMLEIDCYTSVI